MPTTLETNGLSSVLVNGDCVEVMKSLPDASMDAIVCDPPYGLEFMGKKWDAPWKDERTDKRGVVDPKAWGGNQDSPSGGNAYSRSRVRTAAAHFAGDGARVNATLMAWHTAWCTEAFRVLKPGGHLLAFGGTRTFHRLACAVEDAGFEIRDSVIWCYGSGFPKSADVSKMLDKHEQKQWIDVSKSIDNMPQSAIVEVWKEHSKTASCAGLSFQKSRTEIGTNTLKSGSVPASVLLQANPENSDAVAVIAELSLIEARRTCGVSSSSAQLLAEKNTMELRSLATIVANSPVSLAVTRAMPDFSAQQSAWGRQNANTADKLKAVEALRTWLGSKPSSRLEVTAALCAALTDDLKHITLSQSKTFQNFDTIRQTDCASAISATITEFTAASLISFTVDTLKNKAIDKAAGAEREVVGRVAGMGKQNPEWNGTAAGRAENSFKPEYDKTVPATDDAKTWEGWGTALKPAFEPVVVGRKPLAGTVAENVLKHGTGAMNIAATRIPFASAADEKESKDKNQHEDFGTEPLTGNVTYGDYSMVQPKNYNPPGRWPANLLLSHSPSCVHLDTADDTDLWACVPGCPIRALDAQSGTSKSSGGRIGNATGAYTNQGSTGWSGKHEKGDPGFGDVGGASRYFMRFDPLDAPFIYHAKANKKERDAGCENLATQQQDLTREPGLPGSDNPRNRGAKQRFNHHPTVKPVAVMAYLARLVTPTGGWILDPFMGSGTTGIAAFQEGFNFMGIEKEADYMAIAEARIRHAHGNAP